MTLGRARVIKAAFPERSGPPSVTAAGATTAKRARRVPREAVEARDDAARIVASARAEAEAIVAEARAASAQIAAESAREARELELAKLAAELLAIRAAEEQRAERELDRTVQLAVLLAERIVGEALRVEPERIAAIATEALRETRGARRVRIEASPEDVVALQSLVTQLGLFVTEIATSTELSRGSLVVHTDLGRVDARLEPQLARLAAALREALR